MYILETKNVTKKYVNHLALNKVSIHVPKGSIFGLLGPNGAGKTTLIRIINQITGPDSGEVIFNGKPMKQNDVSFIGYLPEERGLYKKMKVGEQALYLSQLKGLNKTDALKKLKYWFEKLDIINWWNKKVEELSKGMQQKVQFIVTILHEPSLLIFDEPFSGFDPINTNLLKNEIIKFKEQGTTIIFSTHNMESVEELCDHITLINKSECILDGEINEIRKKFKSKTYEVSFLGNLDETIAALNNNIKVIDHICENGMVTLKVKLEKENDENNFLSNIMKNGRILSFKEILPSMNDIFIKSVENSISK